MKFIIPLLFLFVATSVSAQKKSDETRIIFYNVENLFDTQDDPKKNDNEFLPTADREWNQKRYDKKIQRINAVLDSIGDPLIAGFCEVENKKVVEDVVNGGNLKNTHSIVHFESLDQRGIDNALIYDSTLLELKDSGFLRFKMPEPHSPSRDIIWAKFTMGEDSIMAIVNHWPSRRGGQVESEPKRLVAAASATEFLDSVQTANKYMKIVFMGDLNDYPDNRCPQMIKERLVPMISEKSNEFGGTHCYRGEWHVLDHIFVSKNFLKKGSIRIQKKSGIIHSDKFLLDVYKGNTVPFRTYGGRKYLDGYSDHLPVSVKVKL